MTVRNIIKHKNLLSYIKTGKEIVTFADIEIEKLKFYCQKSPIILEDIDNEKALLSNKISSGNKSYKYFICYLHNDYKVIPYSASKNEHM